MNNFGRLYRFEMRKILRRRITLVTMIFVVLLMIAMNVGEYVAGSKLVNKEENVLAGRKVDDQLLSEMREALEPKTATMEDGSKMIIGIGVGDPAYAPLIDYLYTIGGNFDKGYNMTEAGLKQRFDGVIDEALTIQRLTEDELSYWQARRAQSPMPLTYGKLQNGWGDSVCIIYVVAILATIAVAATLSGVFSDEGQYRTDAVIFSTRNGKKRLVAVKLLSGATVGLLETLVLLLTSVGTEFAISGFGGGDTSVQFFFGPTAMDMKISTVFLIYFGIMLVIGLLLSAVAMCLSQLTRNSIAVIAVMMLLWLLSMLNLPYSQRLLSQIFSYMPVTFLGSWTFSDYRTVRLFGHLFTILEAAPVLYLLLTAAFAAVTVCSYRRCEVNR